MEIAALGYIWSLKQNPDDIREHGGFVADKHDVEEVFHLFRAKAVFTTLWNSFLKIYFIIIYV